MHTLAKVITTLTILLFLICLASKERESHMFGVGREESKEESKEEKSQRAASRWIFLICLASKERECIL